MKVLTVLIPVYNTEKYIRRCLDSVTARNVRDDIEVLVVSDGSKDGSEAIAREYEAQYPDTVRVVAKENGGHGSTINKGLELATGKYFRVLDSDDWFDIVGFGEFVARLKNEDADLVVCDYRKEFIYNSQSVPLTYKDLEDGKTYVFDEIDLDILNGEYFVMATSTYKTSVLRDSGLKMLEKTFYVDMQFNVVPMIKVKTFTYYELDVYRYFIGRPDQSMNLNNFVRNQNDHKKMITWIVDFYTDIESNLSDNLRDYLGMIINYTLYTHYMIYCSYDTNRKRAYNEIRAFDKYLLDRNPRLYEKLNEMSDVRAHRKSKFKGVKINNKLWKKLYSFAKLLRRGA